MLVLFRTQAPVCLPQLQLTNQLSRFFIRAPQRTAEVELGVGFGGVQSIAELLKRVLGKCRTHLVDLFWAGPSADHTITEHLTKELVIIRSLADDGRCKCVHSMFVDAHCDCVAFLFMSTEREHVSVTNANQ